MKLTKLGKKGFTLIEIVITLVIVMIIAFGVQVSILATITAKNINNKMVRAEDLAFSTINVIVKNTANFEKLYNKVIVKQNSNTDPNTVPVTASNLTLNLYSTMTPVSSTQVIKAADLMTVDPEELAMKISAAKIDNTEVKLHVSPIKVTTNSSSMLSDFSQRRLKITVEVSYKFKKSSSKFLSTSITKILTKPLPLLTG